MRGYNVLHPMGWDAFGQPAENEAIKRERNPREMVQEFADNYKRQMNLIGLSYDWDREVNSSDPAYYKWTQWIFLLLLKRGLAYRAHAPVNWCPKDKTVLANEEVVNGRCWRCDTLVVKKQMPQWFFKITAYGDRLLSDLDELDWPEGIKAQQRNWIGRSEGAEVDFSVELSFPPLPSEERAGEGEGPGARGASGVCYDTGSEPAHADAPEGDIMHTCRILMAGLLCLNAALAAAAPPAADTAHARQTIQRELNAMDAAFARKDLTATYAFYAPDYRRTDLTGKSFDLASDKKGAAQVFPILRSVQGSNHIQSITVAGVRASVTVATHGHLFIQPVGAKSATEIDDRETRNQIWVAKGSSWLLQRSRTVSSRETVRNGGKTTVMIDGKPQK
jgi:hypothetical protein